MPDKIHLMGYDQHGLAFMSQILNYVQHFLYHLRIQCRSWFVKKDNLRIQCHCTGNGNSLLLPAGELYRIVVFFPSKAHFS